MCFDPNIDMKHNKAIIEFIFVTTFQSTPNDFKFKDYQRSRYLIKSIL